MVFPRQVLFYCSVCITLRLLDRDRCCSGYVYNDMQIMLCLRTETADSLSITATGPVADRFGWMTYSAMALKLISESVDITSGELTTADIRRMSLSPASRETVCGSNH